MRHLRELGQNAVHPYDLGLAGQPDEVVLGYAGERGWCVVSSDIRVLHRAHERARCWPSTGWERSS